MRREILLKTARPDLPSIIRHRKLCLECDLAELAGYYGTYYSLPLCDFFDFTYERKCGNPTDNVSVYKSYGDVYGKCGVKFIKTEVTDEKKYYEYIFEQLEQGNPLIVHMDCYYLEWDQNYRTFHNNHSVLVTGVREGAFYLSDPYYGKSGWLCWDDFSKGSKYYFETDIAALKLLNKTSHKKCFCNKVGELYLNKYFKGLELLGEDLRNASFTTDEADKAFSVLQTIELNKQRFLMFIYEWENAEGHHRYSNAYFSVWTRWQVLKVYFFKAKCGGFVGDALAKFADYLSCIRIEEERAINEIICGAVDDGLLSSGSVADMGDFCNNKGLTELPTDADADYTGFGEYICIGEKKRELEGAGYTFLTGRGMDNIACGGQEIKLSEDAELSNVKLTLLVTAACGGSNVNFKFVYSDGTREDMAYSSRDWDREGDDRIVIGSSYRIEDGLGNRYCEKVHADELTILIPENKRLTEIVLPECRNIHILAIRIKAAGE